MIKTSHTNTHTNKPTICIRLEKTQRACTVHYANVHIYFNLSNGLACAKLSVPCASKSVHWASTHLITSHHMRTMHLRACVSVFRVHSDYLCTMKQRRPNGIETNYKSSVLVAIFILALGANAQGRSRH